MRGGAPVFGDETVPPLPMCCCFPGETAEAPKPLGDMAAILPGEGASELLPPPPPPPAPGCA